MRSPIRLLVMIFLLCAFNETRAQKKSKAQPVDTIAISVDMYNDLLRKIDNLPKAFADTLRSANANKVAVDQQLKKCSEEKSKLESEKLRLQNEINGLNTNVKAIENERATLTKNEETLKLSWSNLITALFSSSTYISKEMYDLLSTQAIEPQKNQLKKFYDNSLCLEGIVKLLDDKNADVNNFNECYRAYKAAQFDPLFKAQARYQMELSNGRLKFFITMVKELQQVLNDLKSTDKDVRSHKLNMNYTYSFALPAYPYLESKFEQNQVKAVSLGVILD
jgi:hypothetical protein